MTLDELPTEAERRARLALLDDAAAEATCKPADSGRDGLFHFACSLRRMAAHLSESPVRCLCGAVQTGSLSFGHGAPPPPLQCVVCADLAPAHLAGCRTCRRAVTA